MMKTIWACILTAALFSIVVGCSKEEVSKSKKEVSSNIASPAIAVPVEDMNSGITIKDKDGLILFSLSLNDALGQILRKETSDEIKITQSPQKTIYVFNGHVLSCGTHMVGNITEEKAGDKISYKASFKVSTNPYDITSLEIDALQDIGGLYSGTIKVDGKNLDIALL